MTGKLLTAINPAGRFRSEGWGVLIIRLRASHWILAVSLFAGCSQPSPVEVEYEPPQKTDANFANLPLLIEGIAKSRDVLLREGLPSEFWEPELRERELNQKATIKLHGYHFYDEPIAPKGTDGEHLTALFSDKKSFKRYAENKRCSGYHPDYCLEWKSGEVVTQALICFECREIKLFGPKYELHCDLSDEAETVLTELLSPYQKNRPVTKASK
jgi:hypothetical protein